MLESCLIGEAGGEGIVVVLVVSACRNFEPVISLVITCILLVQYQLDLLDAGKPVKQYLYNKYNYDPCCEGHKE
jgi:hypothetical protein